MSPGSFTSRSSLGSCSLLVLSVPLLRSGESSGCVLWREQSYQALYLCAQSLEPQFSFFPAAPQCSKELFIAVQSAIVDTWSSLSRFSLSLLLCLASLVEIAGRDSFMVSHDLSYLFMRVCRINDLY